MNNYRYTSAEKSVVLVTSESGEKAVPRGHRFWSELGIDAAEAAGEVAPFVGEDEDKKGPAKSARDAAINSNISVLGVVWQVGDRSEASMNRALGVVARNPVLENVEQEWILADNTSRLTTASDLRSILDAKAFREQEIYRQYNLWLSGDMAEDFTVS